MKVRKLTIDVVANGYILTVNEQDESPTFTEVSSWTKCRESREVFADYEAMERRIVRLLLWERDAPAP